MKKSKRYKHVTALKAEKRAKMPRDDKGKPLSRYAMKIRGTYASQ